MDQVTKQNYIDMIDKVGSKLSISENLKDFINSYDGSNEEEFTLVVASAIGAMIKYEQAKIKADAYDKIMESNRGFNEWFSGIKNEYKMLEEGVMPIQPTSMEEDLSQDEPEDTPQEQ